MPDSPWWNAGLTVVERRTHRGGTPDSPWWNAGLTVVERRTHRGGMPDSPWREGSGGLLLAACVDARDVVGVLLRDDAPLDLHRRRHLTPGLGEVHRQDAELADLLGPRHRLVRV